MRPILLTFALMLSACSAQIQHGLDERDANEIISVLTERGFKAQKVPEKGKKPTWAIELDDAHATDAMRVLSELKLPRVARPTTKTIMQSSGLIETPTAERLRQLEAQEGDLEEALETMDGVSSASVELVVPPTARPGQPATPSKASVLLRVRPEAVERLQSQRAELRALVAGAVEGLKADDVVIVIDQVTLAPIVQPPVTPEENASLRPLVVGLGLAVSILALLLVVMASRMRGAAARPQPHESPVVSPPPTTAATGEKPAPSRPVVNAQVQRKVA